MGANSFVHYFSYKKVTVLQITEYLSKPNMCESRKLGFYYLCVKIISFHLFGKNVLGAKV